jgi:polyphosphate kinase 2 (PPK2 family)
LYFQRYLPHFPTAGEIVIFDRGWYNRAGVEYVMAYCTKAQHHRFLQVCPEFELYVVDDGITLIKYWLEVGMRSRRAASRRASTTRCASGRSAPPTSARAAGGSNIRGLAA